MSEEMKTSRRDFLKISAAGAAAVAATNAGANPIKRQGVWTSPKQINPNIDNLRVVFAHDSSMVNTSCSGFNSFGNMTTQNSYAEDDKIKANLDKMAIALTNIATPNDAWDTIFMKPEAKAWNEVKVAVKVNGIGENHPRLAVVGKVCEELIRIGVTPSNITIYDACHGSEHLYPSFVGSEIPLGVVVDDGNKKKGNSDTVTVADGTQLPCTDILATKSGSQVTYTKDILVNLAVCKNHGWGYGQFTMTLKNHIGSLKFTCPRSEDDLPKINKSEAILGDFSDPSTPARQQICIIDALWSSTSGGPYATPDVDTNTLIMGTSSPIVDYLTGKNIRDDVVNDAPNYDLLHKIIQDFGHELSDVQNLEMIDALDFQVGIADGVNVGNNGQPKSLSLVVNSSVFKSTKLDFKLPGKDFISSLTVYDMKGKMVRNLMASAGGKKHREVVFDGKDNSGNYLATGSYVVNLVSGSYKKAMKLSLIK